MGAMTETFEPQPTHKYRALLTPVSVLSFWAAAAFVAILCHRLDAISAALGATLQTVGIFAAGFAYMRLGVPDATVDHALVVGVVWLVLGVITEVAMAENVGHGWYELLGSPARPLWRDLLLFAWVAAPAVFARRRS